jgi:hypothetical protein
MKRGSGIKGRDDRSSGIEIRIADALAKINPTDPLAKLREEIGGFFFFVYTSMDQHKTFSVGPFNCVARVSTTVELTLSCESV